MKHVSLKEYEAAKAEIIGGVKYEENSTLEGDVIRKTYTTERGTFYEVNDGGRVEFWSGKHPESRIYDENERATEAAAILELEKVQRLLDKNSGVTEYSQLPDYKAKNSLVDVNQIVCWPQVKLGGRQFHFSTQLAGLMAQVDTRNGKQLWLEKWIEPMIQAASSSSTKTKGSASSSFPAAYKVTPDIGLNIRTGPGASYSKLGAFTYGTVISVESIASGWAKITYAVLQNIALILATPKGSVPLYRDFGLSWEPLDKPMPVAQAMMTGEVRETIEN